MDILKRARRGKASATRPEVSIAQRGALDGGHGGQKALHARLALVELDGAAKA